MAYMPDSSYDAALDDACNNVENLYLCSQEPSTFTEASSTYKLATKASPSIGAAANRTGGGRQRTVAAITDGTVDATGTATHWALTDDSLSILKPTGALSASQSVTNGNTFTTTAFEIGIADAT